MQNIKQCEHYHHTYSITEGVTHSCKKEKWVSKKIKCPNPCPHFQLSKYAVKEVCRSIFTYIGTHLLQTSNGVTYFDVKEINALSDKVDFDSVDELFDKKHIWYSSVLNGDKITVMYRLVHSYKISKKFSDYISVEFPLLSIDETEEQYPVKWYEIHPEKVVKEMMDYSFFLALVNKKVKKDTIKQTMHISEKKYKELYRQAKVNGHLNVKEYRKYYTKIAGRNLWKVQKFPNNEEVSYGMYNSEWKAIMVVEELKKVDWDKKQLTEIQRRVDDYFDYEFKGERIYVK